MVKIRSEKLKKKLKPLPEDPILRALARNQVMTYSELNQQVGASGMKLSRMAKAGLLIPVGSGIYASSALDPLVAAVLATTKYYPQAVISGFTALQIHGLGEEYIEKIDVDVRRETSIRNKMLRVHRVPHARLVGIITFKYQGVSIRIYDPERTLCEAYLLDPEGAHFFKALKRYVANGKIDYNKIQKYDKSVKTHVLDRLRQEVADA